jgi:membrane protein DedA with SNARE-associated domain
VLALLSFTHFVSSAGLAAVFVLSVLQSCCVPTSSELTLGFAGVLASEGKLNLVAVILVGAAGETVGAYIAWFVGRYGGRPAIERYGRYVLLSPHDLDRAEAWYDRHGPSGVFVSRLIPVIRNFVAVPAGVAEVPLVRFGLLTALGSLVWDGAMAGIGYGLGNSYQKVMHGVSYAGYVIAIVVVAFIAFVVWHRWQSYRAATRAGAAGPVRAATRAGAAGPVGAARAGAAGGAAAATPAGSPRPPAEDGGIAPGTEPV